MISVSTSDIVNVVSEDKGSANVPLPFSTITPEQANYAPGSTVTITAKEKSSDKLCFDRWEITNGNGEFLNGTASQKTAQLKVNSSLSVKAVYVSGHSLTVNNGTGSGAYRTGDVIEITAFLPAGSEFSSWTLDSAAHDEVTGESFALILGCDHSIF